MQFIAITINGYMDVSERLRTHGYRLTPQRQIILEVLTQLGGHLTINQIYKHVQQKSTAIDRATIYRTLNLFQTLDIVHSSRIAGQQIYEMTHEETHHHLVCEQCGGVQELDDEHFEAFMQSLWERYGFTMQIRHLTIPGICRACQTADDAPR